MIETLLRDQEPGPVDTRIASRVPLKLRSEKVEGLAPKPEKLLRTTAPSTNGAKAKAGKVKAGKAKKEAPAEGAEEPKAEKKAKPAKPAPTEGGKDGELFGVKVEGKPEKK